MNAQTSRELERLLDCLHEECGEIHDRLEELFDKFAEFHETNPHIYKAFVEVSRRGKAGGKKKWGIAGVIEILRWEHEQGTIDRHYPYKISNCYKPLFSRCIMANNPDLYGFFETKELFSNYDSGEDK